MDPPSEFGTFSVFPVEIRRQIWHELLCKPVKTLKPLWLTRARDGKFYEEFEKCTPFKVAIFQSSKACGLEAMEVFYSGKHLFTFCALPSRWELGNDQRADQFIKDFKAWTPLYPTKLAAKHIKNIWLSISVPWSTDCFGNFHMSDYALCMTMIRKLESSNSVRKTCLIDLLFFCNYRHPERFQLLGTSFFRGFRTLTAFEKIDFYISGDTSLAYQTLNPSKPRSGLFDGYEYGDFKHHIMKRIVEVLEPALGPADVVDEDSWHVIEFHPRAFLTGLEANNQNRIDGLQKKGQ